MDHDYDIAIDFMDMTTDRHLWVRALDGRGGFEPAVGQHAIVGDEDADQKVARILVIDADGIKLEILPGNVESHRDVLARA